MNSEASALAWMNPVRWWQACREKSRRWDWNPVFVKEMRQALRGRSLTVMLVFLWLGMVGVGGASLGLSSVGGEADGGTVASSMFAWMVFVTLVAVAMHLLTRTCQERDEGGNELLFGTRLTPGQIVRGKLYAAAYLAFLFVCGALPLLALTTLLGGVDLRTVLAMAGAAWWSSMWFGCLALVVGCAPLPRSAKYAVVMVGIFVVQTGIGIATLASVLSGGGMAGVTLAGSGTMPFTLEQVLGLAWSLTWCVLAYAASVALLSPTSANRALPLRLCATICWVVLGGLSVASAWTTGDVVQVLKWAYVTCGLMGAGLLILVAQREPLSRRVRRVIPRRWPARALAFLFFNGRAGGLTWATLLLAVTLATTWWAVWKWEGPVSLGSDSAGDGAMSAVRLTGVALYLLAYTGTGLVLRRRFAPLGSGRLNLLTVTVVAGLASAAPYIWLTLTGDLKLERAMSFQAGSVLNALVVSKWPQVQAHLWVAGVWWAVSMLLNLDCWIRQIRSFRPDDPEEAARPEAVPPVLSPAT